MTTTPARWFVRTLADADTHHGVQVSGRVFALCGATFAPLPLAYGAVSLPGAPLDPDQACTACTTRSRHS